MSLMQTRYVELGGNLAGGVRFHGRHAESGLKIDTLRTTGYLKALTGLSIRVANVWLFRKGAGSTTVESGSPAIGAAAHRRRASFCVHLHMMMRRGKLSLPTERVRPLHAPGTSLAVRKPLGSV